jgi:hypothetical protein
VPKMQVKMLDSILEPYFRLLILAKLEGISFPCGKSLCMMARIWDPKSNVICSCTRLLSLDITSLWRAKVSLVESEESRNSHKPTHISPYMTRTKKKCKYIRSSHFLYTKVVMQWCQHNMLPKHASFHLP